MTAEQFRNALSHLDAMLIAASYIVPLMVLGMVAVGMVGALIHGAIIRVRSKGSEKR